MVARPPTRGRRGRRGARRPRPARARPAGTSPGRLKWRGGEGKRRRGAKTGGEGGERARRWRRAEEERRRRGGGAGGERREERLPQPHLLALVREVVVVIHLGAVRLEGGVVGDDRAASAALDPLHAPLQLPPLRLGVVRPRNLNRARREANAGVEREAAQRARAGVASSGLSHQRVVVLPRVEHEHARRRRVGRVCRAAECFTRREHDLDIVVLREHQDLGLAAPVRLHADPRAVVGHAVVAE